jgi:hypothetical protein
MVIAMATLPNPGVWDQRFMSFGKIKGEDSVRNVRIVLLLLIISLMTHGLAAAQSVKAPDWQISQWINGPGVTLSELRGKVVVVEFFQLWCPGCNSFSIPLMKKWNQTFSTERFLRRVCISGSGSSCFRCFW